MPAVMTEVTLDKLENDEEHLEGEKDAEQHFSGGFDVHTFKIKID